MHLVSTECFKNVMLQMSGFMSLESLMKVCEQAVV